MLGTRTQMSYKLTPYQDFAPDGGRFIWEGRPPGEVYLALMKNQGRIIITIPHPATEEDVRAIVIYVEVPEQPPISLIDEDDGTEVVPHSLTILCGPEFDTPKRPQIGLAPPHIRLHCNQVFGQEPEEWKHPWL